MSAEPTPGRRKLQTMWWAVGIVATVFVVAIAAIGIWLSNALRPPQEAPMRPDQLAALQDELRAKDSAEDALVRYEQALSQTADQITALVPGLSWRWNRDSTTISCGGEFEGTDGVQVLTRHVLFDGPIPDTVWPRALDEVRESAATLGATDLTVFADRPGDHSIELTGAAGSQVRFGTKVAASLSARSDCRLRLADF